MLLPKSFNASYGAKSYDEKLPHYYSHNLLARSLHPRCYQNNPRFTRLADERKLPFQPPPEDFPTSAIQQRQSLYEALCATIWDPAALGLAVPDLSESATAAESAQRHYGVSFRQLVVAGLVAPGASLTGSRSGQQVTASATAEGRIRLDNRDEFDTPSAAAISALHIRACNGWDFWQVSTPNGPVRLSRVRQDYLQGSMIHTKGSECGN